MNIIDLRKFRILFMIIAILILSALIFYVTNWSFKIIYPIHYENLIKEYSEEYDLDPLFVAAIIKVESKFKEKAVSHKGAKGLMQISEITGQWAANELNIINYQHQALFNPEVNVRIGCWYLNKLRSQFNNNIKLMLAAYNGGSGNVEKWLKDYRYSEDGITLKEIPFPETKEYIDKVNRNYKAYSYLYRNKVW